MDKDRMDLTTATMLETDIIPILHIQSENLRDNLIPEQLKDGYLSIAFSENDFREFNRDLGVVVAKTQGRVIGHCCVSSTEFNAKFPILDQIVAKLSSHSIPGAQRQPTEATTCFYGPACRAKPFRGRNVLTNLFSLGLTLAESAGFFFCFSFVSSENQRSLKAHLKLPFQIVGKVAYNANEYIVIACKIYILPFRSKTNFGR